jgi:lauroyl/myristoyl acyltransferase
LCRDIEDQYLSERLMPEPSDFRSALRRMSEQLRTNGAIYFAVGGRGQRTAASKFLGNRIIVATGPIAMAHATGAALLPIYTFRVAPGRFEVTIGPPIEIPQDNKGNTDCAGAVQAYADKLTPFVLRDPGQWRGWYLMNTLEPWGGKREGQDADGALHEQQSLGRQR